MNRLVEYDFVRNLTNKFTSGNSVINKPFESDAELLRLGDQLLAITCDSIVEEIEAGIYTDPFVIGWVGIVCSLSDLAAVGAEPLGVLLMENLPKELSNEFINKLQEGVDSACREHLTNVIGGDTNRGGTLQISSTALGTIEGENIISRKGAKQGDILYVSNKLGKGNAYGFQQIFAPSINELDYRPQARLEEGNIIRQYGSSCIDTSDGFFHAIATLMEISKIGFDLQIGLNGIVESTSADFLLKNNLPEWFLLAGPHGEFELVFTIPEANKEAFLMSADKIGWSPIEIGKVNDEVTLAYFDKVIDPFLIANLFTEVNEDIKEYINRLNQLEKQWLLK